MISYLCSPSVCVIETEVIWCSSGSVIYIDTQSPLKLQFQFPLDCVFDTTLYDIISSHLHYSFAYDSRSIRSVFDTTLYDKISSHLHYSFAYDSRSIRAVLDTTLMYDKICHRKKACFIMLLWFPADINLTVMA
jgi:hypothetical protein